MSPPPVRPALLAAGVLVSMVALSGCSGSSSSAATTSTASTTAATVPVTRPAGQTTPGMPPVIDPANVYSQTGAGMLDPRVAGVPLRVYVPNSVSNTVTVIDPVTRKVLSTFRVGRQPQHVVPSYDLSTLWVANNQGGSLTPIDPMTSRPGAPVKVDDPYNLYFTPDGASAISVAENRQRLDYRDPHTMALQFSVPVDCPGINHTDVTADGRFMAASCEFGGRVVEIDTTTHRVVATVVLGRATRGMSRAPSTTMAPTSGGNGGPGASTAPSMPQDIRLSPDGKKFFVADMMAGGVWLIDTATFTKAGFVPTGIGTHGLYPSRDGTRFFVVNRGTTTVAGARRPPGSISVLDVRTDTVVANWPIPGGGSPDMGNLTPDGRELWLGGRYDDEVYCIDTATGALLARIPVGQGPHGLTVWPQPGRYSLGHTGNMR